MIQRHLVVVDGDILACRLYHGVRDRPPADAFGFALGRFIKQLRPTHMVVVFDPLDSTSSWRRDNLPAYKADRPPRPLLMWSSSPAANC